MEEMIKKNVKEELKVSVLNTHKNDMRNWDTFMWEKMDKKKISFETQDATAPTKCCNNALWRKSECKVVQCFTR